MQVKISYILSLLSGILATASVFLTYCSVEILGYNVSSLNGFDFRDLLKDIGGNWLNGLAEYAVIFIFIFGAFTIIYSIVLFINSSKLKNIPLDFIINGVILVILTVVIMVRINRIDSFDASYSIGYGVFIALIAGIMGVVAGILEYRDTGKLLGRFQTAGIPRLFPFLYVTPYGCG